MIEHNFDIPFVAAMALREKQIQQNYRPIIAVHKWFARRPGTLFRALLLSEFGDSALRDLYFRANNLAGIRVADPFMGGGTPLLEANGLAMLSAMISIPWRIGLYARKWNIWISLPIAKQPGHCWQIFHRR
jgi:hypothetical protein